MSAWLATAYALLALGLAWTLAGGAAWKLRLPYIVLAPAVAFALWLGRPDPAGWPTTARTPAHAALVSAVVDEPDPSTGDPGRIYLWLDPGSGRPRAYSLPYSRRLHEQVQQALARVKKGEPVSVTRAARHGARGRAQAQRKLVSDVQFSRHPPQTLPPKVR